MILWCTRDHLRTYKSTLQSWKLFFLKKLSIFLDFSTESLSTYYCSFLASKWISLKIPSGGCWLKNIAQNTFLMPLSFRKHVCRCSRRSVKLWHAWGIHSQDLLGLSFTHHHKQQWSQNSAFLASKWVFGFISKQIGFILTRSDNSLYKYQIFVHRLESRISLLRTGRGAHFCFPIFMFLFSWKPSSVFSLIEEGRNSRR